MCDVLDVASSYTNGTCRDGAGPITERLYMNTMQGGQKYTHSEYLLVAAKC